MAKKRRKYSTDLRLCTEQWLNNVFSQARCNEAVFAEDHLPRHVVDVRPAIHVCGDPYTVRFTRNGRVWYALFNSSIRTWYVKGGDKCFARQRRDKCSYPTR